MMADFEKIGVYPKYLVFKHPDYMPEMVECRAWPDREWSHLNEFHRLDQVEDFVFPLKPDTDHHARVALAAYAESCRQENPQLANDLYEALGISEKP